VRDGGGIPLEKSIRGSGSGAASALARRLTSATASWLVASAATSPASTSIHCRAPPA